ncbi:MAG: polyketide synthesis methyltransferase [Verrucomicrobia bacterium]|nr:polyketide synthesis methyltransferase [Verrucomicrobiota bacterium]
MKTPPDADGLLDLMRGFQAPCVVAAAAELGMFDALTAGLQDAHHVARIAGGSDRAVTILLDALAALGVLDKRDGRYTIPAPLRAALDPENPACILPMILHQANCLRRWSRLAWTAREDAPSDPGPSILGPSADLVSFIQAMNVVSGPVADGLVATIDAGPVTHVLDIGGASGTWTLAWLRAHPSARATIFDLPEVIPLARVRIAAGDAADRVSFAGGDYLRDPLPGGADVAWISAIVHQHSREENCGLYRRAAAALIPGGRVLIRDIVMEPSRTTPVAGALFAVNMLSATRGGGTWTLDELREDLESSGFTDVRLARRDEGMHSIVAARKT